MAVASYTTDLVDINTAEVDTNWAELTGHTGGGAATQEGDYYIQGSFCISQSTGTKTGTACGLEYDYGSDLSGSFTTGDCVFVWQVYLASNAVDTFTNGGLRFGIGSSSGNMNYWKTGGNDFGRYPYGGWQNFAVDPTFTPIDYTDGTPTTAYQLFGSWLNIISAVSKGNPHGVDVMRYGRGELIIEFGDLGNGYGTFAGINTQNDSSANRWGLMQLFGTGYLWKGLMSFGNATNACDFRDSNVNITIDSTPRTYLAFNKIEVNNASSIVTWDSVSFTAADSTQLSPGNFEVVDNATVTKNSCTFTDMGTFIYQSATTADACTWRGCDQITAASAAVTNSTISDYSGAIDTSALVWDTAIDPDGKLDGTTFIKGIGTTHAIEFGLTSPLTMTLTNVDFSGYNAADAQTDSAIHIKRTTGTVTINISGGSTPSYKTDGAIVNIVAGAVTVTLKAQTATGVALQSANTFVKVSDALGSFPYLESVTIVNSGTTATVTHTLHGLSTNDKVYIKGASLDANLGVFLITVTDVNTYTHTMSSTPGSSPIGTITSTFVILNGSTDINGEITMSRVFSTDQNFNGWARKTSGSPYYKTGLVSGTVSSSTGATPIALMIKDE